MEELECNGKNQFLVFADYVNLLGKYTDAIKSTEAPL
jgi:hypothetical protein